MGKLLELLEKLVRAIFGPGDERDTGESEPAPQDPHPQSPRQRLSPAGRAARPTGTST